MNMSVQLVISYRFDANVENQRRYLASMGGGGGQSQEAHTRESVDLLDRKHSQITGLG